MIRFIEGDIFLSNAEALVNTVNTKGVMGKGLALEFKKKFPDVFKQYAVACSVGEVQTGKMHVVEINSVAFPRYVINFPTKKDWKHPSKLEYVKEGLKSLVDVIRKYNIKSIAIPPLGCGNGQLDWHDVRQLIIDSLEPLENIDVYLYGPPPPKITATRAAVLRLWQDYCTLGYELTLLEIHKLLYFFQECGEKLNLNFEKRPYGPFATNLDTVLKQFNNSFIKMEKVAKNPELHITLLDEGIKQANSYTIDGETQSRLNTVLKLIDGFQSPYSLELLSTIHWLVKHEQVPINSMEEIMEGISRWSERKARIMKDSHIKCAIERIETII